VTVVGSAAVDRIDGGPASPGGAPAFAAVGLGATPGGGRVITRYAAGDAELFEGVVGQAGLEVTVLASRTTSGFGLRYAGDRRVMTVDAIGDEWTVEEIGGAGIETTWVHVAALLRSDFPVGTVRALAARHLVSYDGQGLVRVPRVGPLEVDGDFDPEVLRSVGILKLAEDEAEVLAGGGFGRRAAGELGVPEILVTYGSDGCEVFCDGGVTNVPAARKVSGVSATGAGDVFTMAYVAGRARGVGPVAAAEEASRVVAEMLEARRAGAG
jgi:sugar/nucleoside kinase (ribokinase family)